MGAGVVGLIPTGAEGLSADKWAAGPAVGFTAPRGKLLYGLFNQNLFSFAGDNDHDDVDISILQPILNYSLGDGWSVGASEMNVTWDWEASAWSACRSAPSSTSSCASPAIRCSSRLLRAQLRRRLRRAEDLYSVGVKLLLPTG